MTLKKFLSNIRPGRSIKRLLDHSEIKFVEVKSQFTPSSNFKSSYALLAYEFNPLEIWDKKQTQQREKWAERGRFIMVLVWTVEDVLTDVGNSE